MEARSDVHGAYDGEVAKRRRHQALADALERFPAVQARFHAAYGMRLPTHLASAAAFFLGLSNDEAALCPISLFGIAQWFNDLGLPPDKQPVAQIDERVDGRFRSDPPEFVTIASGNTDGSHFGLFYDLPDELPRFVAHGYARDDGSVWEVAPTLLPAVRKELSAEHLDRNEKLQMRAMLSFLDALAVHERAAHEAEHIGPPHRPRVDWGTLGEGPYLPGFTVPAALADSETRYKLWIEEASAQQREPWFERARVALAAGDGNLAVLIGRELHRLDRDETREVAIELLAPGYEALGRRALADIARIHHAHRDLPQVTAYGLPETIPTPGWDSEIAQAARRHDHARCLELLESKPDDDALTQALFHFRPDRGRDVIEDEAIEAFTAILDAGTTAELASRNLVIQLVNIGRQVPVDTLEKASHAGADSARSTVDYINKPKSYVLVDLLLERLDPERRCNAHETVQVISTGDVALARRLLAKLPDDLDPLTFRTHHTLVEGTGRPHGGVTLLHCAVLTGSVDMVKYVLELGVDPSVRDEAGKTAHALAREWWTLRPNDANAMMKLLAPPAPVAPAKAPGLAVGGRATHATFGEGAITAITGAGEGAKLTVKFDSGTKTLLARFLKPVA